MSDYGCERMMTDDDLGTPGIPEAEERGDSRSGSSQHEEARLHLRTVLCSWGTRTDKASYYVTTSI